MKGFTKIAAAALAFTTVFFALCLCFAPSAAAADYQTFTVRVSDNGDGSATVTATIPAGVFSGKIVVTPSERLTLDVDSFKGPAGAPSAINDKYLREENVGTEDAPVVREITGQCVSFAGVSLMEEGTVVFSAVYTASDGQPITDADFTVPVWNLSNGKEFLGIQYNGDVQFVYQGGEQASASPVSQPESEAQPAASSEAEPAVSSEAEPAVSSEAASVQDESAISEAQSSADESAVTEAVSSADTSEDTAETSDEALEDSKKDGGKLGKGVIIALCAIAVIAMAVVAAVVVKKKRK